MFHSSFLNKQPVQFLILRQFANVKAKFLKRTIVRDGVSSQTVSSCIVGMPFPILKPRLPILCDFPVSFYGGSSDRCVI